VFGAHAHSKPSSAHEYHVLYYIIHARSVKREICCARKPFAGLQAVTERWQIVTGQWVVLGTNAHVNGHVVKSRFPMDCVQVPIVDRNAGEKRGRARGRRLAGCTEGNVLSRQRRLRH